MRYVYLAFLFGYLLATVGCSSKERRTVSSDQVMRIAIDLSNIDLGNHQALQSALLKTKKFVIVDRGPGMKMINEERQSQWNIGRAVYEPSSRAAMGGHVLGAGGIVTPIIVCEHHWGFWGASNKCMTSLTITSARTGEILGSVTQEKGRPKWEKLVAEFIQVYPEYFEYHPASGTRLDQEQEQIEKSEEPWTPGEYIP